MAASDSCVSTIYADALPAAGSRRKCVSRQLLRSLILLSETCLDFLLVTVGIFVALCLPIHLTAGAVSLSRPLLVSIAAGVITALSLHSISVRRWSCTLVTIWETERILRGTLPCSSFLLLASILSGLHVSPMIPVFASMLVPAALIGFRRCFSVLTSRLNARGHGADRVVIYGTADTCCQIASTLMHAPRHGLWPVGLIFNEEVLAAERLLRIGDRRLRRIAVSRDPVSVSLLHSLCCDLFIVAAPHLSPDQLQELRGIADQAHSSIAVLHDPGDWAECVEIGGVHLLSNVRPGATWHFTFSKRVADIVLSLVLLLLLAPLMLLIALLISVDSSGPVFFVQERVGKNGRLFPIFKFRSMYVTAAAYEHSPEEPLDPRITRMGRLLRRAGLDELPQLLNVLLGHMSLVGPRPEMPFLVERYHEEHRIRLQVPPGITGLWQLSADRGLPIHQNTQYDLYYVRNRTLCLDWAILIHTLFFAIRGGA